LTDLALAVADAPPDFALLVIFSEVRGKERLYSRGNASKVISVRLRGFGQGSSLRSGKGACVAIQNKYKIILLNKHLGEQRL
jgi:hypothetical protein